MQDVILTGYTPRPCCGVGLYEGYIAISELLRSYAASRKALSVASRISSGVNGLCR